MKIKGVSKPCLVILDMIMPIMGGREFLDIVLSQATLAPIPVLFVSATATRENTVGAVDFLRKPIDLDLLLKLVEHYTTK